MGEWKSRKDSEGQQEPASTIAGTSGAEERDVPVEVFLLADLSIILRLGTWKEGGALAGCRWPVWDSNRCAAGAPREGGRAASRPCEGSQPSVRGAGLLVGRVRKGFS